MFIFSQKFLVIASPKMTNNQQKSQISCWQRERIHYILIAESSPLVTVFQYFQMIFRDLGCYYNCDLGSKSVHCDSFNVTFLEGGQFYNSPPPTLIPWVRRFVNCTYSIVCMPYHEHICHLAAVMSNKLKCQIQLVDPVLSDHA